MSRLGQKARAQLAILALVLALLPALGLPVASVAQQVTAERTASAIDYARWEAEAEQAENLLETGTASSALFDEVRASLAEWRGRFTAAENANASRIAAIEAQIADLGSPPADGATETAAVAERRTVLNEQLSQAQLPRLNASQAYARVDRLIAEIDALLNARKQQQLLELSPSPANPVRWEPALVGLRDVVQALRRDLSDSLSDPERRTQMAETAPVVVFMLALALLALVRGRRWTERLTRRLGRRLHVRGRAALVFLSSLLQLVIPLLGVILIFAAVGTSGVIGEVGITLLQALGALTIAVYFALWLAGRLFPDGEDLPLGVLELDDKQRAAARRTVVAIGVFLGLSVVAQQIAGLDIVQPVAKGVLQFPLYLGLALFYLRGARQLKAGRAEATEESGLGFMRRVLSVLQQALTIVAIVGPALSLIGFVNAAEAIMVPTGVSLAILGVLIALQPVVRDLYALIFRTSHDDAGQALLPVLVNFALAFGALPLLALTWGIRPEELGEIYARFWEGVPVGEGRITPGNVAAVAIVFALGLIATRLFQGALKSTVLPRTKLDVGARNAVNSGVGYVGIALALVIAVTTAGIDLTALGVVLGALSVGIGFGLQNVVNNFVSGLILLIERPISEGDWIEVGSNMGIVKSISVRSTRIETFDRTDVVIPNADLISGTVTNWTRGNTVGRAIVTVGVAYGTNTRRVQEILQEIAREHPVVARYPEPGVDFMGFGADSLDFRIRAILRDVNQLIAVKTEMHHRIVERFAEEGIEIPFAQRDVWLRNPEALRAATPADPAAPEPPARRPSTPPDEEAAGQENPFAEMNETGDDR
ncbi:DUF3772 domain-containing protein [Thetidibacter halocola]|uniref:DUF3772 domain-containing protein n=1 Tax=Thetidibacter halocola TaxID=2827239 RepID=A0A8J7WD71_9RHOB|nr:DUF3772 domain-containing protein [Thetidibacter halocola]MBS0123054.1 DUF3772 domain-containing protein [Thetidibacter halocola]